MWDRLRNVVDILWLLYQRLELVVFVIVTDGAENSSKEFTRGEDPRHD